MGVGRLLDKIKGNPLQRLTMQELKTEERLLGNQVGRVRRDIDLQEAEKRKKLHQGVGRGTLQKQMIAQEIEALDMQANLKARVFQTLHNQLRFVTNLRIVKEHENQLNRAGIWKKLTTIPQEELERALLKLDLRLQEDKDVVTALNQVFESGIEDVSIPQSQTQEKIFQMWEQMEQGALDPEEAETQISMDHLKSTESEAF